MVMTTTFGRAVPASLLEPRSHAQINVMEITQIAAAGSNLIMPCHAPLEEDRSGARVKHQDGSSLTESKAARVDNAQRTHAGIPDKFDRKQVFVANALTVQLCYQCQSGGLMNSRCLNRCRLGSRVRVAATKGGGDVAPSLL